MARPATNFSRFQGNQDLIDLQNKLPAGVTVNVNKHGELTYTVKVTETFPIIGTIRKTVGTFSSVPAAVKALLDYKYRGFLTKEYFDSIDIVKKRAESSVLLQLQQENLAMLTAAQKRLDQTKNRALTAVENERALGVDAILSSLPPHEIPISGDFHLNHPTTGEPIIIVADSIAAWWKLQESTASSGESAVESPSPSPSPSLSPNTSQSVISAEDMEYQKEREKEANRAATFFGDFESSENCNDSQE